MRRVPAGPAPPGHFSGHGHGGWCLGAVNESVFECVLWRGELEGRDGRATADASQVRAGARWSGLGALLGVRRGARMCDATRTLPWCAEAEQ